MAQGSKKQYTRVCEDCGKVMLVAGRCTKRCPACREIHQKADAQMRKLRDKENRARRKAEQNAARNALRDDVKAAEAAGMDYGKWRIQLMLQAQKGL